MQERKLLKRGEIAKNMLEICRGLQVIFGCIILALSIIVSMRWDNLAHGCEGKVSKECLKTTDGVGGIKYCIAVGAYALFDVLFWAADTYWINIPWWLVYGSAQSAGGIALGGGCTLAAMINGWNCEKGEDGGLRLCYLFYANLTFQFALVIVAWAGLFAWCYMRKNYRPDVYSRMS